MTDTKKFEILCHALKHFESNIFFTAKPICRLIKESIKFIDYNYFTSMDEDIIIKTFPEFYDVCKNNNGNITYGYYWGVYNIKDRRRTLYGLIEIYKEKAKKEV